MARFPSTQADTVALAQDILKGFEQNKKIYPKPPIEPPDFQAAIDGYIQATDELAVVRAASIAATKKRAKALNDLKRKIRWQIQYAQYIANNDDKKLKLLGWGAPKQRVRRKRGGASPEKQPQENADNG